MSAYNLMYNPAGYLTNVYSHLISTFSTIGPLTPTRHSTPPPSAREYLQAGTTLQHSLLMATTPTCTLEDTLQHPPNSAYLLPAYCYAYSVPAAAPAPLEHPDNYSPPHLPFSAQVPPSPRQQRVKAYVQQHNKVLHFLCLSPVEFARHAHTLLINLGYSNTPTTPEVWVDWLLNFHEYYLQGNLLKTTQGVTTRPLDPHTLSSNLPFPKTPDALPNFRPCPAPILISPNAPSANSDASPANSNGLLANFDAFPTATDTYPGSPKPNHPCCS
ncbi:hypothetical protein E4T56_gene2679 [Termitomyces sp. T112]|nr:hypothetical protein E4T56_gene2679 [Termitomyces sp. T112]